MIMIAFGISNPKVVSQKKVVREYNKYGFEADYSLAISDSGFLSYIQSDYQINEIFIYTKEGRLVKSKDTNSCSGNVGAFLDVFRDTNYAELVDTNNTNAWQSHFLNLNGYEVECDNDKPYTAVVFWATWVGRLNRNTSAFWVDKLSQEQDINVVCVSLDIREFWPNSNEWSKVKTEGSFTR